MILLFDEHRRKKLIEQFIIFIYQKKKVMSRKRELRNRGNPLMLNRSFDDRMHSSLFGQ